MRSGKSTSEITPPFERSIILSLPISASVPPKPIIVLARALTGSDIILTGAKPSYLTSVVVTALPSSIGPVFVIKR